jgi:hypothetical protein
LHRKARLLESAGQVHSSCRCFTFFTNKTLALKQTPNSTKYLKENENYNEILKKPFVFNLQTESTACRRSSLNRPDEQVKKTTPVPKTKKNEELSMKLLDDPKIPTVRRNHQRPHHSHKPLDIAAEMGLKLGDCKTMMGEPAQPTRGGLSHIYNRRVTIGIIHIHIHKSYTQSNILPQS